MIFQIIDFINPRPRVGGRRVIVVRLCVCVCVCVYVCLSVCLSVRPSVRPSVVFLENHGSSERPTWICYEVGGIARPENKTMERRDPGRQEKRTAAAVSVH